MRGHITQRTKGSWTVRVELPRDPQTGKRRQKTVTMNGTKKAAEARLAQMLVGVGQCAFDAQNMTVSEFLEKWLEAIKPTTRANTFASCSQAAKKYSELLGTVPLSKLTGLHIQHAVNREVSEGRLAPATILLHLTKFRVALSYAVDWDIIPKSPARRISCPERGKPEIDFWEDVHAKAFLVVAEQYRYFSLFFLGLHTGMRMGEMLGLSWKDIDLDKGLAYVRRTATQFGTTNAPKRPLSRREVPLTPETVKVIKKWRKQMMGEVMSRGQGWDECNFVFLSKTGRPVTNMETKKGFHSAVKRAGVKRITPHGMRHTFATSLLHQGVDPTEVAKILGHSVATLLNTYAHALPSDRKAALDAIGKAFG